MPEYFKDGWKVFIRLWTPTKIEHPELGTYILPIKILYSVHSTLFLSPVHLVYDEELGHYILKPCHPVQRLICLALFCLACLNIFQNVLWMGRLLLADTGYLVAYFDFFYILILDCFIFVHMHLHCRRLHLVNGWLQNLQKSSLAQFCKFPVWKAKLFGWSILLVSLYLPVVFTLTMLQLDFFTIHLAYDHVVPFARQIFYLDQGSEVRPFVRIVTLVLRWYDAMYMHVTLNAFIPIHAFCCLCLVADFLSALLSNRSNGISVDSALHHYYEYKETLATINSFFGSYCFHFVANALTFHSAHLLEALNTEVPLWKLNMYIYILYLFIMFGFPMKIWMKGKKIKRWLWKDENFSKIPAPQMKSILYDLTNDRLGLGGGRLFVVTAGFTGTACQMMLTYALLNMSHKK